MTTLYVADWYASVREAKSKDAVAAVAAAFRRARDHDGVKLGPVRRDKIEEREMRKHSSPIPGMRVCRVYAADVLVN
jgi:hypothetical protein